VAQQTKLRGRYNKSGHSSDPGLYKNCGQKSSLYHPHGLKYYEWHKNEHFCDLDCGKSLREISNSITLKLIDTGQNSIFVTY
jgi:hypothetical protein